MDSSVDAEFFERLAELNDRFAASLPQTLGRLSAVRDAFDVTQPSPEHIDSLLGHHARVLEQRLRVLTTFDTVGPDVWEAWLTELDVFVTWGRCDPKAAYPNDESAV
jgi:hypothetical protein